ncbi:MAG: hypothetical protein GWP91_18890 [Rhodobacterales bacterium]|nr:hypothetical protein [Rhodobacterales bacterium]
MNRPHPDTDGLDWPFLLDALAGSARTTLGRQAMLTLQPLTTIQAVSAAYDGVDELAGLEDEGVDVGVGAVHDIRSTTARAAQGGVLDDAELRTAGNTLVALNHMAQTLDRHGDKAPTLAAIVGVIELDFGVVDTLSTAWEPTGELSARAFPQLGELRERIAAIHSRIRTTLDGMVSGETLGGALQDTFWTQRDNRYVLPLKQFAKGSNVGIVHGTSRTGQTVFVEPHEVVALNNNLRITEGELAAEEHKIRATLSRALGSSAPQITDALEAAVAIDLTAARLGLSRTLQCPRPSVGTDGVIRLQQARHPVLALRGVDVVANDLRINSDSPALVISGPNAGGKTVALKTIGLCALLVQRGCFVPADEGSRVDLFEEIAAAIGDQQTVEGDLSSFSAHLVVLGEMLQMARPGALLLLDELATGTDPTQGAALAQAVLETLLDRGARLVITTHFGRLKGLATVDPRFAVAATRYADGQPTYQLVFGTTGESRALDLAYRMGMDEAILDRARELMGTGEAQLAQTLEALEEERTKAEMATQALAKQARDLQLREAALARRDATIAKRAKQLEQEAADAFLVRLKGADKAIGQVVADLQANPGHARANAARAAVSAMRGLAPKKGGKVPAIPAKPTELAAGDRVKLVKVGTRGEVVDVGNKDARVRVGSMTLNVKLKDPERIGGPPPKPQGPARPRKVARAPQGLPLNEAVRLPSNTLDLRGQRVEEGLEACDKFFDRATMSGHETLFLLHGHGTGAMKVGVRGWLKGNTLVGRWAPASEEQGGDAFTVVTLTV